MHADEVLTAKAGVTSNGPARNAIIEVRDLTKVYDGVEAVRGISFRVDEGEIFGFIGPNGAGKTTTIRILATLLAPTSGDVWIAGLHAEEETEEVRRSIGYMPDEVGLYDDLSVEEYLDFFARAYRLDPPARRRVVDDVLALTDLGALRGRLIRTFSKGMKQRLCVAKTLIHDPRLLILDEPASALDPRARIELRVLLKELRAMGKTIFISSHILSELGDLCTSIGIIEKGRIQALGPIDELQRARGEHAVEISFAGEAPKEALEALRDHPSVRDMRLDGERLVLQWTGPDESFIEVLGRLAERRMPVLEVRHRRGSLEDVFLELTRGDVE